MPGDVAWRTSSHSTGNGECAEVGAWRTSSHSYAEANCAEVGAWRTSSHSAGGNCAEVAVVPDGIAWRTSSHSGGNGQCAEVGQDGTVVGVLVRDTMDRDGPWLALDAAAWGAFLAMVRQT